MRPIDVLRMRKAVVGISDPYFSSVVALWPFDETAGATSWTDYSGHSHTLTKTGTVTQSSSQAKFGSTSLNIPGGQWSYLTSDSSADFTLSGDFTVDVWVYPTAQSQTYAGFISKSGADTSGNGFQFYRRNDGTLRFQDYDTGQEITGSTMALNAWTLCSLDRSGSTVRMYQNGVYKGSFTATTTFFNGPIEIGRGNTNSIDNESLTGYIQDVRITKGVARYGGTSFTPPTAFYPHS